MHKYPQFILL